MRHCLISDGVIDTFTRADGRTMQVVETSAFTRRVAVLLTDEEYRALQTMLVANPEAGRVIVGTGGARKVRWALAGRGGRRSWHHPDAHDLREERAGHADGCAEAGDPGGDRGVGQEAAAPHLQ